MSKREDFISWDEYFMGVALLSAKRSKDPSTQVGACIVNEHNKIVSVGYNGMPRGCDDDLFPWSREGDLLDTKYPYVTHAELNAILNNYGYNLENCKIYVPLFPCNECTKAIIQSGIREIFYLSDKYAHTDSVIASKRMLDAAGVNYHQLKTNLTEITLSFDASKI
jgi:dCMP deaminase